MVGLQILLPLHFPQKEGLYLRRLNYFELYPLFAVLLNLMSIQSYAQVTITGNTVDSQILESSLLVYYSP